MSEQKIALDNSGILKNSAYSGKLIIMGVTPSGKQLIRNGGILLEHYSGRH